MSLNTIAILVAIAVQFAGIVWGAALLKSAVDSLKDAVKDLSENVKHLDDRVDAHDVQIEVLKERMKAS